MDCGKSRCRDSGCLQADQSGGEGQPVQEGDGAQKQEQQVPHCNRFSDLRGDLLCRDAFGKPSVLQVERKRPLVLPADERIGSNGTGGS